VERLLLAQLYVSGASCRFRDADPGEQFVFTELVLAFGILVRPHEELLDRDVALAVLARELERGAVGDERDRDRGWVHHRAGLVVEDRVVFVLTSVRGAARAALLAAIE